MRLFRIWTPPNVEKPKGALARHVALEAFSLSFLIKMTLVI